MPPYSTVRKSSAATATATDQNPQPAAVNGGGPAAPRRTTASGRAVRANTTRPANYYARPFGPQNVDHDANLADGASHQPHGFFPALTYFTDAITALPRETMKHFTLMKEVEAKIYNPTDQLGAMLDALLQQPVPTRQHTVNASGASATAAAGQGLLSLTANNSTSGSANASLVNGVSGRHSAQPSMAGSLDGLELPDNEEEKRRRTQYHQLRGLTHSMLANLDEKIGVLNEANRVLAQQHARLNSVMPGLEEELSEEARLGSMTHWAYSDNRLKTKTAAVGSNRPRDVAATNSLAAAANMLHEAEIAQARTDAGREAARGKPKAKRALEIVEDSDFDTAPKVKKGPKAGKGKAAAAAAAATGLGISSNGEPGPKRRKPADKAGAAPGMARTTSTQGKGAKGKESPRSTPLLEQGAKGKTAKAKPAPTKAKKTLPASAQASPMLASSPLASSFNPATMEVPPGGRPTTSRIRQNSATTNLRHEHLQIEDEYERPVSAAGKTNGQRTNGRRNIQETTEELDGQAKDEQNQRGRPRNMSDKLKREDTEMRDANGNGNGNEREHGNSRPGSNSRKGSGRSSKVGTPRTDTFPTSAGVGGEAMSRGRSTRRKLGDRDSTSSEPRTQGTHVSKHKRHASGSHLVKQLAPFNKSPNMDRHSLDDDDESLDGEENGDEEEGDVEENKEAERRDTRRSSTRRPISRRNTVNSTTLRTSPAPMSRDSSPPASPPPTSTRQTTRSTGRGAAEVPPADEPPALEEDEEESDHDPDDPDEPKYCYCNRGSYGEMIACDNESCPREWFHLGCTELTEAPAEDKKWYCQDCRPKGRGRQKGTRGGRTAG